MVWHITIEHNDVNIGNVTLDEFPYRGLQDVLLNHLDKYKSGYYVVSTRKTNPDEIGPRMLFHIDGDKIHKYYAEFCGTDALTQDDDAKRHDP